MLEPQSIVTVGAGSYRLRQGLAVSSYGVIWRAKSLLGGPDVALKFINHEQMQRAHPAQRDCWSASAASEIAFLRSLGHWDQRHIVRLIDSGEHDGLPVMALELLGPDLGRHLASERTAGRMLPLASILDWLGQINQALAKVHQYGWRYLDLKPANVLMHPLDGSVRLADFGASRLAQAGSHGYGGTASWQAPEQFFANPDQPGAYHTDTRTDYFAMGALLYFLVSGGLQLRFCSDCGQAYREQTERGAALLLARHDGRIPPILRDDEAALFVQRVGDTYHADSARKAPPAHARAALQLLRALLAPERADRPQHALQISRMLAAARPAIPAPPVRSAWRGLDLARTALPRHGSQA